MHYDYETWRYLFKRMIVALAIGFHAGHAGFGQDSPHGAIREACDQCHTASSWTELVQPLKFNHASTEFSLEGQHLSVACRQCHATLRFAEAPHECRTCHDDVHRGELGMSCERCHTPQSWLVPDMPRRHTETRFPLLGAHISAPCQACHVNQQKNEYTRVPSQCYACHGDVYASTVAPAHAPSGIGTDCEACHAVNDPRWGGTFNHSRTAFPLSGAHKAIPCSECHTGNRYSGTPTLCYACHADDYAGALSPAHASGGFSTECVACHSTMAWKPSSFNHNGTSFPLTGAHNTVPCGQCHTGGQYAGTPSQCSGCHLDNYNQTTNPAHAAGGFSFNCQACHTTTAWQPATFDHSKTAFLLTGAHAAVPCTQCHAGGQYAGTPTACSGCHLNDYNQTTVPPHASGGFPLECQTCHTTTAWQPASFDHGKTAFPLTGAHVAVPCAQCHAGGQYAGTPATCSGCHLNDYNQTTNPAHGSAGFPLDCQSCHTTSAWVPSTFDHNPFFPIAAGSRHAPGRWTACSDCHTVATDFKIFSCITCHTHSQAIVDPKHTGVRNYRYDSQACYQCHPRGVAG